MSNFTQAEYSKTTQDEFRAAVIQTYKDNSPFIDALTYQSITGGTVTFNRELTLPTGVGFREVDGEYTSSQGEVEPVTEALKIAGGRTTVDRAILKMYGPARLATDLQMQVSGLARKLNAAIFKGDGLLGAFTGLQTRIQAGETIVNGDAALSLAKMRQAYLDCKGNKKAFFMGEGMYSRLWAAYDAGTLQNIVFGTDDFGKPVATFAGVPLILAGEDADRSQVLDFSETNSTTSIYCVSLDEVDGVVGIQNSELETLPMTEVSVVKAWDIEWLNNFMIQTAASAIRISGITDAAVTA